MVIAGVRAMAAPAGAASSAAVEAGGVLSEGLLNLETVKAFGGEHTLARRYDTALGKAEQAWRQLYRKKAGGGVVLATIVTLALTGSLLLAAREVQTGRMSVGDFVLVNTYLLQLIRPLETLGYAVRDIAQGLRFIERMLEFLQIKPEVVTPFVTRGRPRSAPAVRFETVTFTYQPDRAALRDVSFSIPAGSRIALVGTSGAGKSTVARLLLRFFEPDAGRILLDGRPIRTLALSELRSEMALVPQETVLLDDTIAANIAFARPTATQDEIEDAARRACIHEVIASLPDGYATIVGERGLKLSGGEKQRIAIARAALARPRLWILDEATSSLDAYTERQILKDLPRLTEGATCLLISHRLPLAALADTVLVFRSGRIIERGRHHELLARAGPYAALWLAQCGKQADPQQE